LQKRKPDVSKGAGTRNGKAATAAIGMERAAPRRPRTRLFADIAQWTSREAGRAPMFALAVLVIVTWAVSGPFFGFSDTWQLVINTGTTIVTFLMVFLIQNSQNRDAAAIQVKLDELIRVSKARNTFIGVEHLTDEELHEIRMQCEGRVKARLLRREQAKGSAGQAGAT
jgi:low affinity Fe/Cu permease